MPYPASQNQEEEGLVGSSQRGPIKEILEQLWELNPLARKKNPAPKATLRSIPKTTPQRQRESASAQSLESDTHLLEHLPQTLLSQHDARRDTPEKTVLYLAYGSNLAAETFLGMRGIKPLSQINVVVPSLRLTFDLPGVPYVEPCFAATQFRNQPRDDADEDLDEKALASENAPLLSSQNTQADRPLIGVVYEVTLEDYATIIATEGGGRGYKDIVVDCYPFPDGYDPADPVPDCPDTQAFKAHTLLSPTSDRAALARLKVERRRTPPVIRPRPGYAQPSSRYLNLITTGAAEHDLPVSYRTYLAQIHTYRITTIRQRVGKATFLALWGPLLLLMLALSRMLAEPDGRSPPWLMEFSDMVMYGVWKSYDKVFAKVFGDGERTIGDSQD
ncbi:gliotoxin biosynthesis protein GliK [Aspergillus terreus]|uniref:gamma-glutamylcyclotransferase n=1 Tax=Aspergillus terreus TaxID=33178 RepID=A0A5M3YQD7_ASPTE|nr:hypothetical protein ATETN484_0002090500 [Aspergillus terreus]GFF15761.1 gliotoxin biosynthesis protein GliK [Aspergillus terreus]